MKKIIMILALSLLLTACGITTISTIPNDAEVALCPAGDTFEYVFKGATVYEFYTNDTLQSEDMLNIVQNAVNSAGTVRQYLDTTFGALGCTYTDYVPSE